MILTLAEHETGRTIDNRRKKIKELDAQVEDAQKIQQQGASDQESKRQQET